MKPIYVPMLKWKRGELHALRQLHAQDRSLVLPMLELLEDSIDVDEQPALNVPTPFERSAAEIQTYWGPENIFVDAGALDGPTASTPHPLARLFLACRQIGLSAIPIVSPGATSPFVQAVASTIATDGRGCGIRVDTEDIVDPSFSSTLTGLLTALNVPASRVDLFLDWGAIDPIAGATTALAVAGVMPLLPHVNNWRSVVFTASSFPMDLRGFAPGVHSIPRAEWAAYKTLLGQQPGQRAPSFGDYTIAYPIYAPAPYLGAASIRYTTIDDWIIFRGRSLKGPVHGGFAQFPPLCAQVVAHPAYSSPGYSWGDGYIQNCANGQAGTGNLTTWRTVGTNRHITFVARQLSNYHAPSSGIAPPPVGP